MKNAHDDKYMGEEIFEKIKEQCSGCEAWGGDDCTRNPITEGCLKQSDGYTGDNPAPEYESVNHPNHYHPGDYEAIKVIEAWLGKEGCYQFCLGNAIKYVSRLDNKPSANKSKDEKTIEDIKKAIWYLDYAKDMKK